jgi:hypothetical protein
MLNTSDLAGDIFKSAEAASRFGECLLSCSRRINVIRADRFDDEQAVVIR